MYRKDVGLIKEHVSNKGSDGLVDVIEFVLCTIQAGLSTVKAQRQDIKVNDIHSKFLWGQKRCGLIYARDNKDFLWSRLQYLLEKGARKPETCKEAIKLLMKVPNLGMVKAAFVAQCLGFNVACIDSHNLKRLGMKYSEVTVSKSASKALIDKRVANYVKLTQQRGSAYWWNTWCKYVAGNRANKKLLTGRKVSAYHVECIVSI